MFLLQVIPTFNSCLFVLRHKWCDSHHDPRAKRPRGRTTAGAQCDGHHDDYHRDEEPAEVRQQDVSGVCLHLVHRADDNLPCLACLLLHPEVQIRQRTRQEPGTHTYTERIYVFIGCRHNRHIKGGKHFTGLENLQYENTFLVEVNCLAILVLRKQRLFEAKEIEYSLMIKSVAWSQPNRATFQLLTKNWKP